VDAGDIIFEIFSPKHLIIKGHVLQSDIQSTKDIRYAFVKKQELLVKIDHIEDKLLSDELVFDPETMSATLEIPLKNENDFKLGDSIALHLGIGLVEKYVTVPLSAVVDINTKPYIFIRSGNETFRRIPVKLGISNGERVAVLDGIDDHYEVVISGGFDIYASSLGGSMGGHEGHNH